MKVGIILNPIAGDGRLKRDWADVASALERHLGRFEMRETQAEGDAERLAIEFAADGYDLVIAAGGDGTASETADGLLQAVREGYDNAALGLLACGTGSDFARGLGLPDDLDAVLERIAACEIRMIDVGRISYIDDHGALASRHFINIASLGLSGHVDRAVNADRRKGRIPAKALFLWRTVTEFFNYHFDDVVVTIDDGEPIAGRVALVAIANGPFFGGGMMIAPDASLDDGQFDIVILHAGGKVALMRDIRLLYTGQHRNHPAVTILRGRKVLVEPASGAFDNSALVDIDGEAPGRVPAEFEIMPRALKLRC
ncbi:MAG TPA: diacylglycerol kinase family protein [Mesorhizobium sp.]|uniref:diacylglycerol/lipid kinase family protein n=1 Tax=Mesorhizobium sp. TaxID=1871066 RepID=UPI002DDCFB19|nr:diacylglycerol kinase family protein [Mesorhizobium sp.]HEV2505605.1 diacylglycerol kinase family protein [Mesorhizobium sp.]